MPSGEQSPGNEIHTSVGRAVIRLKGQGYQVKPRKSNEYAAGADVIHFTNHKWAGEVWQPLKERVGNPRGIATPLQDDTLN